MSWLLGARYWLNQQWSQSEEGRVWLCWVSITHTGTLMWGGGATVWREGGRGACMSGQVSGFCVLKKSIKPEGVGLNHTHSSSCLSFIVPHTHTETLNPEPGLGHLSHAEERGWKKLWTWSACFEVGAVILRALSIEGQAGPPSLVSSRPSCNYSTHLKCKAQGDRGGQVSSDTLSLVKHIVQTSKEISSPKPVVGAGASESNAVMMEPRGLTPLCALTDCSLKSTSLVGG